MSCVEGICLAKHLALNGSLTQFSVLTMLRMIGYRILWPRNVAISFTITSRGALGKSIISQPERKFRRFRRSKDRRIPSDFQGRAATFTFQAFKCGEMDLRDTWPHKSQNDFRHRNWVVAAVAINLGKGTGRMQSPLHRSGRVNRTA